MESALKQDLRRMTESHPEGFTSQQIVTFFQDRGFRMSEATFRKYVQLGLLPRSRRVGAKGKHKGSRGIYPHRVLDRILTVKRLMDEGYTMEEIQGGVMRFRGRIDDVEHTLSELFRGFRKELAAPRFDASMRANAEREIEEAQRTARDLIERLEGLERRLSQSAPQAAADEAETLSESTGKKFF